MKKIVTLIIAASLTGFFLTSQTTENCPVLNKIAGASGVFRADGINVEWRVVLQGIIAEKAAVQSFEMALAIQESQSAPSKFQHCTYLVGDDKTLDMKFVLKNENEKEFTIQTVGNLWKKADGPFGLIDDSCEKTAPENCIFTVDH
ncbi:hypothetical protein ARAF_0159 [Arsenophonus endosymbiont of Aleurodicus floccissimus]|uniref:DUF3757 domain-containing protein n=1 Tax=Arsenophonus endosymbiont of Aleurodicus floccissimus TaxID=2152761 RepID=UPI000E6B4BFA|nr:DUF3757 domain-containing protein [Arsenophonus endosymbiont of Aleurodicus floccissimus]SPP31056.1 hypothetical protein ARAF_0159 [Arsenophonus endosymbiont of Aleurodicus floccissimus]